MVTQGHPRAIFNRAIERGNVLVAEATVRELGHPSASATDAFSSEGLGLR